MVSGADRLGWLFNCDKNKNRKIKVTNWSKANNPVIRNKKTRVYSWF